VVVQREYAPACVNGYRKARESQVKGATSSEGRIYATGRERGSMSGGRHHRLRMRGKDKLYDNTAA
jgi:hypothetical protein